LAFAAYNCGDGCTSSAIKKAKSNDYFDLSLPLETKLYVPRLLAIAEIIKHAKEYGIVLPQIKDAPFFTKVDVNKSESLSHYAKSTGTDLQLLKKLNPDYHFEKTSSISSVLLVPVNSRSI
jgi:membrane-bound lytic murein transglycosylase D